MALHKGDLLSSIATRDRAAEDDSVDLRVSSLASAHRRETMTTLPSLIMDAVNSAQVVMPIFAWWSLSAAS